MNVDYLREGLDLLSQTGCVLLNQEKLTLIENSLIILQSENKFSSIYFWGRINGIDNDYYIALGYLKDCLRGRRFFFSTNCVQWYLLPPPNTEQYEASQLAPNDFQGDISNIIYVPMVSTYTNLVFKYILLIFLFFPKDPKFVTDPNGVIIAAKAEQRLLKEEDRLACVVTRITNEAALLPRGSLNNRIDGKIVYSQTFRGLTQIEASKIDNFQLYRTPLHKWNANLLKKRDYNYATDIFDTIDSIVPEEKSFSLSLDSERGLVVLKSLFWPGMMFFHKCRSRKHGFCYFGEGKKNMDLLFML